MRKFYLFVLALGLAFQAGAQTPTPFTCTDGVVYQIVSNSLYKYTVIPGQTVSGELINAVELPSGYSTINAIGYDTVSHMIWGAVFSSSSMELIEIDANGNVVNEHPIQGLPTNLSSYQFQTGVVHDGYLYMAAGSNDGGGEYIVVDIDPNRTATYLHLVNPADLSEITTSISHINISTYGAVQDWAYDTLNNTLIAVTNASNNGSYVVAYNPVTGAIVSEVPLAGDAVNSTPSETGFGSLFFDANGNLYAFGNASGNLYQINTSTGNSILIANLGPNSSNDGASCPNAIVAPTATPITLQSFTVDANGNTASVQWTTVTEIDNKGFYVERSPDGQTWQDLTFVASQAANGNSSASLHYQYTDPNPQQGYNYYRLKQVDLDGAVIFSGVQSVVFSNIGTRVYPNPTNGTLHVTVGASGTYRLVNAGGAVALKGSLQSGDNLLNVTGLASGIYFIQILSDKNVKNTYKIEIK